MLALIGGGGFIGSNLALACPSAHIIERGDELDFDGADTVIHLAANADVRGGWDDPYKDLRDGTTLTQQVLEAMRAQGVRRLVFASSGIVYPPSSEPHYEEDLTRATSLYAASKIAGEQLIYAYAAAGHIDPTILRFVSVLGPFYSHGLICDFVAKLDTHPTVLPVLAPGTSQKSYVHVADVVAAVETVLDRGALGVFNVATAETATPVAIGEWVMDALGLEPNIVLKGETWVGDNPVIRLDTGLLQAEGWAPANTIEQAVRDTVAWLT